MKQKNINKQVKVFIQEICVSTWGMNDKEIKNYCLMVAKQNLLMANMFSDYLPTAKAYAKAAGKTLKGLKNI